MTNGRYTRNGTNSGSYCYSKTTDEIFRRRTDRSNRSHQLGEARLNRFRNTGPVLGLGYIVLHGPPEYERASFLSETKTDDALLYFILFWIYFYISFANAFVIRRQNDTFGSKPCLVGAIYSTQRVSRNGGGKTTSEYCETPVKLRTRTNFTFRLS